MKQIGSLVIGITIALSTIAAAKSPPETLDKEHPSISSQIRLSSWWIKRHAEKMAVIEAANDTNKTTKVELLMVGDSITHNFDKSIIKI